MFLFSAGLYEFCYRRLALLFLVKDFVLGFVLSGIGEMHTKIVFQETRIPSFLSGAGRWWLAW